LKKNILTLAYLASWHVLLLSHASHINTAHVVWFPVSHSAIVEQKSPLLSEQLTIEKALDCAFSNRSILYAFTQKIKAKKSEEQVALAGYLPQISFQTEISQSQKQLNGQLSFKKHQQFFNLQQLLYSFAGPLERYQITQFDTTITQLQQELKRHDIQFEVEKNYLVLYRVLKKSPATLSLKKSTIAQFERATAQNNQELLSPSEWYKEQADYAFGLATVGISANTQKQAEFTLQRSLELSDKPIFSLEAANYFVQKTNKQVNREPLETYVQQAFSYRKELSIKDEEIEQNRALQRFYQRSYLPKFSFFTNIVNGAISTPTSYWLLGVLISWEFDGLANVHRAEEEKALVEVGIMEKKDLEQTIALEVQTTYYDEQKLQKELQAAYKQFERDRELFILRKKQFEIGELSAPDFVVAQKEWEFAQFTVAEAEIALATKHRELLYKCGYPPQNQDRL
jgi:outer membrane protein TolC